MGFEININVDGDGHVHHQVGHVRYAGTRPNNTDFNKALIIIWIVLILVTNVLLLAKLCLDKEHDSFRGLLRSTFRWILATLAFGDILVALYTLAIIAHILFLEPTQPADMNPAEIIEYGKDYAEWIEFQADNCVSIRIADIYGDSYFPFVYTFGLFIMICELHMRAQINNAIRSEVASSVVLAAIPWIVGLILIFTLNYAGFDSETCYVKDWTTGRYSAIVVVGILLPTCALLVFAFVRYHGGYADAGQTQAMQVVAVAVALCYLPPCIVRPGHGWVKLELGSAEVQAFGWDFFFWLHYSRCFIAPALWVVMLWYHKRGGRH